MKRYEIFSMDFLYFRRLGGNSMNKGYLQKSVFFSLAFAAFFAIKGNAQSQPYLKNVLVVGNGLANFPNQLGADHFGASIADVGDLDGDGVHEVAVGAYSESIVTGVTSGSLYILYLKDDGTVKNDITGKPKIVKNNIANAINFGISVANIGDIDGDGVVDLAVGANGNPGGPSSVKYFGDLYICFMKTNGTIKSSAKIVGSSLTNFSNTQTVSGPQFGKRIALLGDYDGDGVNDIVVGCDQDKSGSTTATGSIFVITLTKAGAVKKSYKIDTKFGNFTGYLSNGDNFGSAVCGIGDYDGDGYLDVAVGAANTSDGAKTNSGAVYLISLDNPAGVNVGKVKAVTKLSNANAALSGVFPASEFFGTGLALLKTFDYPVNSCRKSGVKVLAVGAVGDNDFATRAGAVWLIYFDSSTRNIITYQKISGKNQAIKSYYPISGGDAFGTAICSYQSRDTNSTHRILVGAPNDSGGTGAAGAGEYYLLEMRKFNLKMDTVVVKGPSDSVCANARAYLGVVFENYSNQAVYSVPVTIDASGAGTTSVKDTLSLTLNPCAKDTFWFKYPFPTSTSGLFNLKGYLRFPGDFYPNDDSATGKIYVLPSLTIPSFGNDTVYLCKGNTKTLDLLNSGANYYWYKNDTLLPSATGETLVVSATGNYIGIAKTGTCSVSDTMQVNYVKSAKVTLGPDKIICYGDSALLDAGYSDASHMWADLAYPGFPLSTNQTFMVNDNTTRGYIATVTYSDHGTSCAYADTINITYNHVIVNLDRDTAFCTGQIYVLNAANPGSTYSWYKNGVKQPQATQYDTLTQTGTYAVMVQNGKCYGTDTMKVQFYTVPSVNFTPKADTLCKGQKLTLNAGNPGYKHTWYKNGTDLTLADTTTQYTVSTDGQYKVVIANTQRASCNASDQVDVKYNILSVTLNQPKSRTLCQGQTLTLTANVSTTVSNPIKYQWYKNGSPIATTSTYTITAAGSYWVVVNVGYCTASDSISISYTPIVTPNFGHNDTLLCQGTTIILDAGNPGATYYWLTPRGTKTTEQVTVDTSGMYNVQVKNAACTVDTFIRVKYIIIKVNLGNDTTLCYGRPITLDAKNNNYSATYQWYADGSAISGAVNQKYSPVQPATYMVIVYQKYCSDSGKVHVNFLPSPIVRTLDTIICSDDSLVLDAGNPGAKILWSYRGLRTQTITIHKELSPTKIRTYKAYITNGFCTDTSVFRVQFYDPVVFIKWDTVKYLCDTLSLGVWIDAGGTGSPVSTYDWEPTGDKTRFIKITAPGKYTVTKKNVGGCSATDSLWVHDCPPNNVLIPSAFSPDLRSDDLNDTFKIYNLNAAEYLLTIYNRWGEQVFSSNDPNKGWDGRFQGTPAPEGVYVWTLIYRLHTSTGTPPRKIIRGNVTLIRH
jgi:gliding motility-associated-like protein